MANNLIRVHVVTPWGTFVDTQCQLLVLPISEGEQGVMYSHAPFLCAIYPGEMRITTETGVRKAFVSAGYAEVQRKQVIVITNAAEWAEDIDLARAETALNRAQERLSNKDLPEHLARRNRHALRRAKARVKIAKSVKSA